MDVSFYRIYTIIISSRLAESSMIMWYHLPYAAVIGNKINVLCFSSCLHHNLHKDIKLYLLLPKFPIFFSLDTVDIYVPWGIYPSSRWSIPISVEFIHSTSSLIHLLSMFLATYLVHLHFNWLLFPQHVSSRTDILNFDLSTVDCAPLILWADRHR